MAKYPAVIKTSTVFYDRKWKRVAMTETNDHVSFTIDGKKGPLTKVFSKDTVEKLKTKHGIKWALRRQIRVQFFPLLFTGDIFILALIIMALMKNTWITPSRASYAISAVYFIGLVAMKIFNKREAMRLRGALNIQIDKSCELKLVRKTDREMYYSDFMYGDPLSFVSVLSPTTGLIGLLFVCFIFDPYKYSLLAFLLFFILGLYIFPIIVNGIYFSSGGEFGKLFAKIMIWPAILCADVPKREEINMALDNYNKLYRRQRDEGIIR